MQYGGPRVALVAAHHLYSRGLLSSIVFGSQQSRPSRHITQRHNNNTTTKHDDDDANLTAQRPPRLYLPARLPAPLPPLHRRRCRCPGCASLLPSEFGRARGARKKR